jgi:quercetin dioxygenase-like cupin family protein
MRPKPGPELIELDRLPETAHAHEFIGGEHGGVPFSIIFVDSPPGAGPRIHRHPYPEVLIVKSGEATFQLGEEQVVGTGGQIAIALSGVPHGFVNTGTGNLRLVAIHGAAEFNTEWQSGRDPAWASKPR